MEQVVLWAVLIELIAPYDPEGKTSRPPLSFMTMMRVHSIQQWCTLYDPVIKEASRVRHQMVQVVDLYGIV